MTGPDTPDDLLAPADPAASMPPALHRPRRWLVPLGLGGVMALAASLAAILLSSAQGWQGPALAPADDVPANVPAVAVDVPGPASVASSAPAALPLPALAAATPRRHAGKPAIRPAATPVLAQAAAGAAPAAVIPAPAAAPAAELAMHADDSLLPQLSPAEAAEIERRAERRAAREAAGMAGPGSGLGLRAGPLIQASTTANR